MDTDMDLDDPQAEQEAPPSTNIQNLLDRLRTSATWAQVMGTTPTSPDDSVRHAHTANSESQHDPAAVTMGESSSAYAAQSTPDTYSSIPYPPVAGAASPSVASLLSQLQASSANVFSSPAVPPFQHGLQVPFTGNSTPPTHAQGHGSASEHRSLHVATSNQPVQKDFRTMTFQKSLSHVAALAEDDNFVQAMKSMKEEQDALERKLWEERTEILDRHEEKVKAAKAKAQIIGAGLSKPDADLLSDAIRREMQKFELERALPAWDGLVAKHQAAMEVLTVPAMFVTSTPADIQKQKKVMQLVEGTIYGDS